MTVIYYRKSDGAMLGSSEGKELNILAEKSDWEKDQGVEVGTLVLDSKPDLTDKIVTVANNQLVLRDDLIQISAKEKKKSDRQSGLNELKKLGLTDDQLKALFGG